MHSCISLLLESSGSQGTALPAKRQFTNLSGYFLIITAVGYKSRRLVSMLWTVLYNEKLTHFHINFKCTARHIYKLKMYLYIEPILHIGKIYLDSFNKHQFLQSKLRLLVQYLISFYLISPQYLFTFIFLVQNSFQASLKSKFICIIKYNHLTTSLCLLE